MGTNFIDEQEFWNKVNIAVQPGGEKAQTRSFQRAT